jgi:hypothetical protein
MLTTTRVNRNTSRMRAGKIYCRRMLIFLHNLGLYSIACRGESLGSFSEISSVFLLLISISAPID